MVREFRMDMHTLLCFKWITDEDLIVGIAVLHLPCITGNSAQCYVAAWMRGGLGENGDIRMAVSLPCPPETITTLFIGSTPIQFFFKLFLNDQLKTRLKRESEAG